LTTSNPGHDCENPRCDPHRTSLNPIDFYARNLPLSKEMAINLQWEWMKNFIEPEDAVEG